MIVYDVVVLGAGPAGITAGIYAKRQNLNCLVIGKSLGGQMASKAVDIENYPGFDSISGFDLIDKMVNQLRGKGVEILEDEIVKVVKNDLFEAQTISGKIIFSRTVIIATGAEPRRLAIEGESDFLGKGVSYCTTCDGPLFKNKRVAVIGGGDAAFEAARFFANYASKIYVLERGERFLASVSNQEIVKELYPKVETYLKVEVVKIVGEDFVRRIDCMIDDKEDKIEVEGVFVQIGYVPATSSLGCLVELNDRGEVVSDGETLETKTSGLFVAGDVKAGRVKQIVVACGDGAKAAMSAYRYLRDNK